MKGVRTSDNDFSNNNFLEEMLIMSRFVLNLTSFV